MAEGIMRRVYSFHANFCVAPLQRARVYDDSLQMPRKFPRKFLRGPIAALQSYALPCRRRRVSTQIFAWPHCSIPFANAENIAEGVSTQIFAWPHCSLAATPSKPANKTVSTQIFAWPHCSYSQARSIPTLTPVSTQIFAWPHCSSASSVRPVAAGGRFPRKFLRGPIAAPAPRARTAAPYGVSTQIFAWPHCSIRHLTRICG